MHRIVFGMLSLAKQATHAVPFQEERKQHIIGTEQALTQAVAANTLFLRIKYFNFSCLGAPEVIILE